MRFNKGVAYESSFRPSGLLALSLSLLLAFALVGCSGGTTIGSSSTDTYSVEEYNSDVANLERILTKAQSLYHQIDAMSNPNNFTMQSQVDSYNRLVDQYNAAADEYRAAAQAFNDKYPVSAEGASGNRSVSPDDIDLPPYK